MTDPTNLVERLLSGKPAPLEREAGEALASLIDQSETKLVERLREADRLVTGLGLHAIAETCCEAATALASLADELRLAREALKQAAEMLQASLPYWQMDERGNGPDCTPLLQAILNANAALKKPR